MNDDMDVIDILNTPPDVPLTVATATLVETVTEHPDVLIDMIRDGKVSPLSLSLVKDIIFDPDGSLPDEFISAVITWAYESLAPWDLSSLYPDPHWLNFALFQFYDRTTMWHCPCGVTFPARKAFMVHTERCTDYLEVATMMQAAVPTQPSNRNVLNQLREWGATIIKEKGDWTDVRLPTGDDVKVRSSHCHSRNGAEMFTTIYRALGITPQQFWSGPDKPELKAVPNPEPAIKRARSAQSMTNQVYELLLGQGTPMSAHKITEMTGLTKDQVTGAFWNLKAQGMVRAVKRGMYQAIDTRKSEVDVTVDVHRNDHRPDRVVVTTATEATDTVLGDRLPASDTDSAVPMPMIVPSTNETDGFGLPKNEWERPKTNDIDSLMETVLDLLFPDGMHIKASDLKAIVDWQEATKNLLRRVRG